MRHVNTAAPALCRALTLHPIDLELQLNLRDVKAISAAAETGPLPGGGSLLWKWSPVRRLRAERLVTPSLWRVKKTFVSTGCKQADDETSRRQSQRKGEKCECWRNLRKFVEAETELFELNWKQRQNKLSGRTFFKGNKVIAVVLLQGILS